MPRTRNVSRSQWDAANAQHGSRVAKENGYDSGKENASRATRSTTRAGSRRAVLGSSSLALPSTKGKGKPNPPSKGISAKIDKLPLQDITKRFLPAPESANRGYTQVSVVAQEASPLILSGMEAGSRGTSTRRAVARANHVFPSSLPPSSPPSVSSEAPQQEQEPSDLPVLPPSPPLERLSRRLFAHAEAADEEGPYNAWSEFDYVVKDSDGPSQAGRAPRHSDPFGFFALEKKLQQERELDEEEEAEAGGLILVADTSSPRPVRRLRHASAAEPEELPLFPPTPHKAKGRARHSFGGGSVGPLFSPHPSSCPSSPSPSKPSTSSSAKRKASSRVVDENEEELGARSNIPSQKVPGKKQAKSESEAGEFSTRRQLRSRSVHQKPESSKATFAVAEKRKGRSTKRAAVKKNSKSKKIVSNNVDDHDMEQWERERQVRLKYYRELAEYDLETENVYVI